MNYICLMVPIFIDDLEEQEKRKKVFRDWEKDFLKPKIVLAEKPIKNLITEILEKDYSD